MVARRRKAAGEVPALADGLPSWLFRFKYAEWGEGFEPGSPDRDAIGRPFMGSLELYNAARQRWRAARRDWCRTNDRIMSGVWPETHERFASLAEQEPGRVVRPDFEAEADNFRERARVVMAAYGGKASDQGRELTVGEADFPVYGSGDPEEDS